MEPFRESLQTPTPFTDKDWEHLRPKLQAQADIARKCKNREQVADETSKPGSKEAPKLNTSGNIKERWESLQAPIRKDLSAYVDELLRVAWDDGRAINSQTASRFAADALVYARHRYATDNPEKTQPGSAFQLLLHNMKWLFENKVKPLTEVAHGVRDLFRCAECGHESKAFAFEGLIQHFKAKHTQDFGTNELGGVTWYSSLWPEKPPFRHSPDPDKSRKDLGTPFQAKQAAPVGGQAKQKQYKSYERPAQTLYQPVPGPYGFPPTSPGFYPAAHGPLGGYYTPTQYRSLATSPAFSQTSGYHPPSHYPYIGQTSPFDGHGPPFSQNPQTPVSSAGPWAMSPGYLPGQHSFAPSPAPSQPSFLQVQMDEVGGISQEIWQALDKIKLIPPSVRMYVIIQHVVSRFRNRFSNEPNLDLFFQCLESHPLMQLMKSANGLACKVCVLEKESREEGHSHAFPLTGGERKLYSFYYLLMHFKNVHVETKLALENAQSTDDPEEIKRLDWKEDMIELPDDQHIASLRRVPGMNDPKAIQILKEVFPSQLEDNIYAHGAGHNQHGYVSQGHAISKPSQGSSISQQVGSGHRDPSTAQDLVKTEPDYSHTNVYSYPATSNNREDEYDPRWPSGQDSSPQRALGRGHPEPSILLVSLHGIHVVHCLGVSVADVGSTRELPGI